MIDFDNLKTLAESNPKAFEIERTRIIGAYIRSLPEDRRTKALAMQYDLDMKRDRMTSVEFTDYLANRMNVNVVRLGGLLNRVKSLMDGESSEKIAYIDDYR